MSEIPFGSLQQHLIGEFSHTRLEKQPCKQRTYQTKCQQNPGTHQQQAGTKEEMKMVNETNKILEDPNIKVTATCVRVPVFYSHSESVNIETEKKITAKEARAILATAPGVQVYDNPKENMYPLATIAAGEDATFVGRIREDESIPNGLNMWVVADNVRKGAALNAVQIAEKLLEMDLVGVKDKNLFM